MGTPRVNTPQARKRHEGINKICANCGKSFYAIGPYKKTQTWCGECIKKRSAGKASTKEA